MDSGAYKIVIDTIVAQQYRLISCGVIAGNFGKLGVPGSSIEYDYIDMVEDSFELRVGGSIKFVLSGL